MARKTKSKIAKAGAGASFRGTPKLGRAAGRAAGKGGTLAGRVVLRSARNRARLARRAPSSQGSTKARYLRYGVVALAGLVVGALLGRSRDHDGLSHTAPADQAASGPGAQTWGSGTPLGTGGRQLDAERATSDTSEPLVGERRRPERDFVPDQQKDIEQRVRTRLGEDPRTREMPRVNVQVNEGVAELRGIAPSEEAKEAAGEVAASIEGVREVRNLLTLGS